jgi:quinol-cytochrome oxidoreductase complex cytochrome b subunit
MSDLGPTGDLLPGETNGAGATPVRLSPRPDVIDGKRVLGIVAGKPVAGERKEPADDDMVFVWPHLLVRHGVAALAVLFLVLVIAVFFDAPLRDVANPTVTPNPEKAPWYFAALQELLAHFHPLVAGVLIPGAIVIGLIALPYIDRSLFIRPQHRRVAVLTFTAFLVIFVVLTIIGFAFRGPNWGWVWPWQEWHGEL